MVYDKNFIEQQIKGEWYRTPKKNWYVDNVVINNSQVNIEYKKGKKILFIAIDSETWHKGSGNRGIYAGWTDTHGTIHKYDDCIAGIIVSRPIPELNPEVPQYVVRNTYGVIKTLADYAYKKRKGKMIAITGTAGKSTTKNLFNTLLSNDYTTIATRGNHNTRTGVPLTIACSIIQPDFTIIETAISSLWMRSGGILKNYAPDVAMITSIDGGQQKSAYETACLKSKIAEGMDNKGNVVLNRDMKEYETVEKQVKQYNKNIFTYGFHNDADSRIIKVKELRTTTIVKAEILGEIVKFETQLNGKGMIQNIVGTLTTLKLLGVKLNAVLKEIKKFSPSHSIQNFETYQTSKGHHFTLLNDSWNATGISMIEAIKLLAQKHKFYEGKTIVILGRIVNLSKEEAKKQHENIARTLIDSNVDIVFAHGPEMKYMLKKLPETMIGGYYDNAKEIATHVSHIIEEDDIILLKGSQRSSDFKLVKEELIKSVHNLSEFNQISQTIPSTGYGVATYDFETGEKVSNYGKKNVKQNQGVGGLLLINYILDEIFANKLSLNTLYYPDSQSIKENKSTNALLLRSDNPLNLYDILSGAIVKSAPNAFLMLANSVLGSNKKSMKLIKELAFKLELPESSANNITGRRISNKNQEITLEILFKVGKILFKKMPFIQDLLSQTKFVYDNSIYRNKTNLFHYGIITHGIFYGQNDSIGIVLSSINGKKYISVVIGAKGVYHRDALLYRSILTASNATNIQNTKPVEHFVKKTRPYKINILGDTYFGEFYTNIRKRQGKKDALTKFGRNYSFKDLRKFLIKGDFNICNFEAAISNNQNEYLKRRKPFVLHADTRGNVETLKSEKINLVTLANNHLMDCGLEGLNETVKQFNNHSIYTMGAGNNQIDAENSFVINVNGTRITFFNAYWYRRPMYEEFDFYAIGSEPGVACINPFIFEDIKKEKSQYPSGKIIVIAHWGTDFKNTHKMQTIYANQLDEAGADLIIGHGAHMIQGIQNLGKAVVAYSIGNGVFNSNGEYNKRFVPAYGMIVQIIIGENNDYLKLRFYPIYINNLKTFWKPRFVTKQEFEHCHLILKSYNSIKLKTGKDEYYYFEIPFK